MRIRKIRIKEIFLMIAFFIITISYSLITNDYGSWNKNKYIGIFIVVVMLLLYDDPRIKLNRIHYFFICYFLFYTILDVIMQGLSLSDSILAIFFTIVLILYVIKGTVIFSSCTRFYVAYGILIGVLFVMSKSGSAIALQFQLSGRIRIYGLFSHPNIYASILFSIILLLDIGIRTNNLKQYQRIFNYTIIIILLFSIYLTNSRTTMILVVTYYAIIIYNSIKSKFGMKSRLFFSVFVILTVSLVGYLFVTEYVLRQETFYTRIDDYLEFTLEKNELIFGKSFTSSLTGRSFEFAIYTILYRQGLIGVIGFFILFYMFFYSLKKQENNYIGLACVATLAVSALGEAYIVNITHLFSCIVYLLISAEIFRVENKCN